MDVTDKYLLEVTSSAKDLGKTIQSLDKLKASLSGFTFGARQTKAMSAFATGISQVGESTQKIDSGKISAFANAMTQLSNVRIKLPKGLDETVSQIQKAFNNIDSKDLYKKANSFARILKPLDDIKMSGISKTGNSIERIATSLGELDFKTVHGQADALTRILTPLADVMDRIAKASIAMQFNKTLGGRIGRAYAAAEKALLDQRLKEKSSSKGAEEEKTRIELIKEAYAKLNEKFEQFVANEVQGWKRIGSVISSVSRTIGKIGIAFTKIGFFNPFKGVANTISSVIKRVKTLYSSLMRIAMYRALRTAIKEISKAIREGLTNLYNWSKMVGGDFAPAVDKIATAMLYLKNSFGAAASPLITYFAPAIDMATDALVGLLNVINQIFARLTGRATWTRALKYPTEFAQSAAGATKKVKDNIQDFDELHILRTTNGGGGASAEDYSKMFEETEFSEGLTEWVLDLKDAIKNGRWSEAGTILGQELNNLVDSIDWDGMGKKLGTKITSTFQFAFAFLKTTDFENIGTSVATFLNGAIEKTDANLVGQTLARKWTAAVDFLYGFVTTFDWTQFGTKGSDIVTGWFSEIDGRKLGETITSAIMGAFDAVEAFLSDDRKLDLIAEDIAGLINGIDWFGILSRGLTIGAKIIEAIVHVITGAISGTNPIQTAVDNSYGAWKSGQYTGKTYYTTSTVGQSIVDNLADSVNNADIDALTAAFAKLINAAIEAAWKLIKGIGTTVGENIAEEISDVATGGHWETAADGSSVWVNRSQTSGERWINTRNRSTTPTSREVTENVGFADLFNEGSYQIVRTISELTTVGNILSRVLNMPNDTVVGFGSRGSKVAGGSIGGSQRNANRPQGADKTAISSYNSLNKAMENVNKTATAQNTIITTLSKDSVGNIKNMTSEWSIYADTTTNKVMASKEKISAVITLLNSETEASMKDIQSKIVSSVENTDAAIATPLANIKSQFTLTYKNIGDEASKNIGDLSTKMGTALSSLRESNEGHVSTIKDIWGQLNTNIKTTANGVITTSEVMANGITTAFNKVGDNINKMSIEFPDWMPEYGGKKVVYKIPTLSQVSIPRLAEGGIAMSPTTALIGEAGREAVLPLENNTGWMNDLAERLGGNEEELAVLREQNELLRQIASKNVTISSREVFDAVRDENADYITRTGVNALVM